MQHTYFAKSLYNSQSQYILALPCAVTKSRKEILLVER